MNDSRLDRIEAALKQVAETDRSLDQRQRKTADNLDKLSEFVSALAERVYRHERQFARDAT